MATLNTTTVQQLDINAKKGNTFQFKVNVVVDSQPIQLGLNDKLYFTVKKNKNETNAQITKTKADMVYDNGYIITINPADTQNIQLGSNDQMVLYYDVKFEGTLSGQTVAETLVEGKFILSYSITV